MFSSTKRMSARGRRSRACENGRSRGRGPERWRGRQVEVGGCPRTAAVSSPAALTSGTERQHAGTGRDLARRARQREDDLDLPGRREHGSGHVCAAVAGGLVDLGQQQLLAGHGQRQPANLVGGRRRPARRPRHRRSRHSGEASVCEPRRRIAGRASSAGRTASAGADRASHASMVGPSLQATNGAPTGGASGSRTVPAAAPASSAGAPASDTGAAWSSTTCHARAHRPVRSARASSSGPASRAPCTPAGPRPRWR